MKYTFKRKINTEKGVFTYDSSFTRNGTISIAHYYLYYPGSPPFKWTYFYNFKEKNWPVPIGSIQGPEKWGLEWKLTNDPRPLIRVEFKIGAIQ